jgi:predicted DCC family thiol-disulfide oxidoreductase YuxK
MDKPIIFYDGDCGFCNRSVQFVLNHEKNEEIHFCALQSDFAKTFFSQIGVQEMDLSTFYFWDKNRLYNRSSGALRVLNYLKFPAYLGKIGWVLSRFFRDGIYKQLAKRRMKLAPSFCALPSPSQAKRFLSQKND